MTDLVFCIYSYKMQMVEAGLISPPYETCKSDEERRYKDPSSTLGRSNPFMRHHVKTVFERAVELLDSRNITRVPGTIWSVKISPDTTVHVMVQGNGAYEDATKYYTDYKKQLKRIFSLK